MFATKIPPAFRAYPCPYCFHEAQRQTGITRADWERSKAECQAMGLLNKAGAITLAGKNAIGQIDLWALRGQTPPVTAE